MLSRLRKDFTRGLNFIRDNPQILYTVFLLIVIPIAFLASGQKFLDVATKNQERLEKEKIGIMQDIFAISSLSKRGSLDENADFLQSIILDINRQNPAIDKFKILARKGGNNIVIASLDTSEIGQEDKVNENFYGIAVVNPNSSFISEHFVRGERMWRSIRAIQNENNDLKGFILTDTSMAFIDRASMDNIRDAYYFLFFIILAIFILLVRQARIVDYAVLYKKLKSVDQMKDDFISIAAHELRTPLAAISGYLELISPSNFSENDKENVDRVWASVKRLNALISDILDVARIQQGRMKFDIKKVDISEMLYSVVDSFKDIASMKSLTLEYKKNKVPEIDVDIERLEQVLINLIGNSIKYTLEGSIKIVVLNNDTSSGKFVQIRISDTGLGISSENQQLLFKKFQRIHTKETDDISGTGLGLWISQEIVREMGGKITVESIVGKGSDFIVSFPVA